MNFLFKDKIELLAFIKQWKFQLMITLTIIIAIACTLMFLKPVKETSNDMPIVSSQSNSKEKNNTHQSSRHINDATKKDGLNTGIDENKTVIVDIKGAVEHPDVYKMKGSDRIKDVLEKAKLQKDADLTQVNLSEKLTDQKLIYIPSTSEMKNTITHSDDINKRSNTKPLNSLTTDKINLNTASETDLLKIPGVGPTKVKEILDYRSKNNHFHSIEDIKNIKGIGDKTFEKIKDYITI